MHPDLFRGVVPFVAVAEALSFRKAAVRLGVSSAAVSKAVQNLERDLKVVLLNRSTRSVTLTAEGTQFFERCREAVAAVLGAREAVEPTRRQPEGELVISLPFVLTELVSRGLAVLRARYPKVSFRVVVTDQLSRLTEESVDVALRIGQLADSSLIAKPLRKTMLVTLASPAYLSRQGVPKTTADLATHDCLVLVGPNGKPRPWVFKSGLCAVPSVLLVDHGPLVKDALRAGLGIGQAFDFMVEPELRARTLVPVLEAEWAAGPDIFAVCAPGRRATPRVRAAFEAFTVAFGALAP